jgi:hypothetical protein
MKSTIVAALGLSVVMLSGCGAFDKGHLAPHVASQVMVSRMDPPPGCSYLGPVKGSAPLGELGDAHGDVLRNAVLKGGNYVTVDLVERPVIIGLGSYVVSGRLFACPAPAANAGAMAANASVPTTNFTAPGAAPAVGAASPKPCEPDCATGFTCQLGACVASPAPHAAGPAN